MVHFLQARWTALITDRAGISSMEYAALAVGVVGAVVLGAAKFGNALSTYLAGLLVTVGL